MDNSFKFWQKWLTYANIIFFVFSLFVAFWSEGSLFKNYNNFTNSVFFDGNPLSNEVLQLKCWLFGIIGATLASYHILIIFISENAFAKKQKWSHRAITVSVLLWFIIDSFISYKFGAFHNILMVNMVALVLLCIPLIATRKYFY